MEEYQKRVIQERADLYERIEKLAAFVKSEKFKELPADEGVSMACQLGAMGLYHHFLEERIARFV